MFKNNPLTKILKMMMKLNVVLLVRTINITSVYKLLNIQFSPKRGILNLENEFSEMVIIHAL